MKKAIFGMMIVVAQVQAANVCIDENFDSRETGDVKDVRDIGASHLLIKDADCLVSVVDGSLSPADPFGGSSNKSLRLADFSEKSGGVYVMWKSRAPVKQGEISLDFFVADHGEGILMISVRNGGQIGCQVRSYKGGFQLYSGKKILTLDNKCAPEMKHSLVLDFDGKAGTYSGTLDGKVLSNGEQTEFEFMDDVSSLYLVRADCTSGGVWQGDTYVDNVRLTQILE